MDGSDRQGAASPQSKAGGHLAQTRRADTDNQASPTSKGSGSIVRDSTTNASFSPGHDLHRDLEQHPTRSREEVRTRGRPRQYNVPDTPVRAPVALLSAQDSQTRNQYASFLQQQPALPMAQVSIGSQAPSFVYVPSFPQYQMASNMPLHTHSHQMQPQYQQQQFAHPSSPNPTTESPSRAPLGLPTQHFGSFSAVPDELMPPHRETLPRSGFQRTAYDTEIQRSGWQQRNSFALGKPKVDVEANERGLGVFKLNRSGPQQSFQGSPAAASSEGQMRPPPPRPRIKSPASLLPRRPDLNPPGLTDRDTERASRQIEAQEEFDIEHEGPATDIARSEWHQRDFQRTASINQNERTNQMLRNEAVARQHRYRFQAVAECNLIERDNRYREQGQNEPSLAPQREYERRRARLAQESQQPAHTPPRHRRAPGWGVGEDPFGKEESPFDLRGLDQETALNCLTPPEKSMVPESWAENARTREVVATRRRHSTSLGSPRLSSLYATSYVALDGTYHPFDLDVEEDGRTPITAPSTSPLKPILKPQTPAADSGESPGDVRKKNQKRVRFSF